MTSKPARVLLVDDDSDLRAAVKYKLELAGHEVFEASDGLAALSRIGGGGVDVMVLDLMMPGLNGHEVLQRMKEREAQPQVIVVSAQSSLENRLSTLYSGAVDFLAKPFEPQELLARVAVAARQKENLEIARTHSRTDPLTGLGNRLLFEEILAAEAKRARRLEHPLSLAYLDVDGLKAVNDAYGHGAGDDLLKAVAQAIRRTCRDTDVAARIGGDEFAVILPDTGRIDAEQFISRLMRALADSSVRVPGEKKIPVSASAGISVLGEDALDGDELRSAADRALYAAKRCTQPS